MTDSYDRNLKELLLDKNKWMPKDFTEDFRILLSQIEKDVSSDSISGKIASIFIRHQIIHEITKDLIKLSHLYLQAEIWPTKFVPKYDDGKERMTGWYIDYYEGSCIECKSKDTFVREVKSLNRIRNKVAHNITGKNEVVINSSYKQFSKHFNKAIYCFNDECLPYLLWKLDDLTSTVDFKQLLEE